MPDRGLRLPVVDEPIQHLEGDDFMRITHQVLVDIHINLFIDIIKGVRLHTRHILGPLVHPNGILLLRWHPVPTILLLHLVELRVGVADHLLAPGVQGLVLSHEDVISYQHNTGFRVQKTAGRLIVKQWLIKI